jgi:hypothetical protein
MNRPRKSSESFEKYRENLKKEEKALKLYLKGGRNFTSNKTFQSLKGLVKIVPRMVKKVAKAIRIDKNKKGE